MTKRLFITGTDTDIGKTLVACQLMRELAASGKTVAGLKPVAAGAVEHGGEAVNQDALDLKQNCSRDYNYEQVNPILFEEPIAPHIAAESIGQKLTVQHCVDKSQLMLSEIVDYLIVEGAGGWLVPLNNDETMADLAVAMGCDVVLVVGMRLGCINHALLSAQSVRQSGAKLLGWVANFVDPDMDEQQANLMAIAQRIDAPLLAKVPYLQADSAPAEKARSQVSLFDLKYLSR